MGNLRRPIKFLRKKPTYRDDRLAFTVMFVVVCSYCITILMPFPAMFTTAISPIASSVLMVALPFVIEVLEAGLEPARRLNAKGF